MNQDANEKPSYYMTGHLKTVFIWPLYFLIIFVVATGGMYFLDKRCCLVMAGISVLMLLLYLFLWLIVRPSIMRDLIEFSSNYSHVQHQMLNELSIPYCILDDRGKMLWMNLAMQEKTGKNKNYNKNVALLFPEVKPALFPSGDESLDTRIHFEDRDYLLEIKRIQAQELFSEVHFVEQEESCTFYAMYMFDETDINMYIQKIKEERFVVGLINIDNFEEALESVDDVRRSLFIGLVDKRVNKYFTSGAAIVRKLEKDKYMAVFRYKYLEKLVGDKFSLLEDIKNIKIGNDMTLTLSIGIGTGASEYSKNYDIARSSLDLALGRGGDQAVVKDGEKTLYYGGKSQQMEKNTRVKVRVKAHALKQILETTQNVLVMGHKRGDIDSFGASLGIYAICRKLEIPCHIVINEVSSSLKPFKDKFIGREEYPEDLFLTGEEATEYVDATTAVIVVDVNRPDLTECPELLNICKTKIVFDHHRQTSDQITGAVLSYVDPYASSACEMITEMIQYVDDSVRIKAIEADAIYAGINIDTDGFHSKAGPRTFEAVAFLRRHGADVTRVRKMLRNDMTEYRAVAEAVSRAEVYKDAYAIAVFNGTGIVSPTIGGAKAANQLLDISGIKASFVVTAHNDTIYMSARSIDEVNVQIIMEKFGGGGHMTVAGAQLTDCTVDQAVHKLKLTLDKMMEEGEI